MSEWPYPWLPTPEQVAVKMTELGLGPKPKKTAKDYGKREVFPSRAERWQQACRDANIDALYSVQAEYKDWYDRMPKHVQETTVGVMIHDLATIVPGSNWPETLLSLPHPAPYYRNPS